MSEEDNGILRYTEVLKRMLICYGDVIHR